MLGCFGFKNLRNTQMKKELEIFKQHVASQGLKHSQKRDQILKSFLITRKHVSAEELYELVKQSHPAIGYTTVYRTLKLIVSSGLGEQVDFNDGMKRYECKVGREYHAHFICTQCGENFEVFDEKIKELSSRLSNDNSFFPQKHRLEIFGICKKCS